MQQNESSPQQMLRALTITMVDSLILLVIQLTRAFVPITIFMGIIGNWINIIVLFRPTLYKHSCSRYFLALASDNLFLSSAFLVNRLLIVGYQLDVTKISDLSCKLVQYVTGTCVVLSPYFIVLASIDRYFASSTDARRRQFSNVRMTRWTLTITIIMIALYYINYLVLIDLRRDDSLGCVIRGDTIYKQVYPVTQFFVFAVIPPSLMGFFGGMTIYNMKHVLVIPRRTAHYRRTETQLSRMLLIQVCTYIVLTFPLSVTYLILVLPNSLKFTPKFQFSYMICQLFLNFSYVTAFILYFLSADIYRKECTRLFYKIIRAYRETWIHRSRTQNSVLPIANTNTIPSVEHRCFVHNASIQRH